MTNSKRIIKRLKQKLAQNSAKEQEQFYKSIFSTVTAMGVLFTAGATEAANPATNITGVATEGKQVHHIYAQEVNNTVARNKFANFYLAQNEIANMYFNKQGDANVANTLVNLVDNKINIQGTVNAIQSNKIGGHMYFISPNGMLVGAQGVINAGSLTVMTPTQSSFAAISNAAMGDLMATVNGAAKGTAQVNIQGKINAVNGINIEAGQIITGDKSVLKTGVTDFSSLVNITELVDGENQRRIVQNAGLELQVSDAEVGSGNIVLAASDKLSLSGKINAERDIVLNSKVVNGSDEGYVVMAETSEIEAKGTITQNGHVQTPEKTIADDDYNTSTKTLNEYAQHVSEDVGVAWNKYSSLNVKDGYVLNFIFAKEEDKNDNSKYVNNLFNFVRGNIDISGTVNAINNNQGKIGGNLYFLSSNGIVVGPKGAINAGSITINSVGVNAFNMLSATPAAHSDVIMKMEQTTTSNKGIINIQGKLNASGSDIVIPATEEGEEDTVTTDGSIRLRASTIRIGTAKDGSAITTNYTGAQLVTEDGSIVIDALSDALNHFDAAYVLGTNVTGSNTSKAEVTVGTGSQISAGGDNGNVTITADASIGDGQDKLIGFAIEDMGIADLLGSKVVKTEAQINIDGTVTGQEVEIGAVSTNTYDSDSLLNADALLSKGIDFLPNQLKDAFGDTQAGNITDYITGNTATFGVGFAQIGSEANVNIGSNAAITANANTPLSVEGGEVARDEDTNVAESAALKVYASSALELGLAADVEITDIDADVENKVIVGEYASLTVAYGYVDNKAKVTINGTLNSAGAVDVVANANAEAEVAAHIEQDDDADDANSSLANASIAGITFSNTADVEMNHPITIAGNVPNSIIAVGDVAINAITSSSVSTEAAVQGDNEALVNTAVNVSVVNSSARTYVDGNIQGASVEINSSHEISNEMNAENSMGEDVFLNKLKNRITNSNSAQNTKTALENAGAEIKGTAGKIAQNKGGGLLSFIGKITDKLEATWGDQDPEKGFEGRRVENIGNYFDLGISAVVAIENNNASVTVKDGSIINANGDVSINAENVITDTYVSAITGLSQPDESKDPSKTGAAGQAASGTASGGAAGGAAGGEAEAENAMVSASIMVANINNDAQVVIGAGSEISGENIAVNSSSRFEYGRPDSLLENLISFKDDWKDFIMDDCGEAAKSSWAVVEQVLTNKQGYENDLAYRVAVVNALTDLYKNINLAKTFYDGSKVIGGEATKLADIKESILKFVDASQYVNFYSSNSTEAENEVKVATTGSLALTNINLNSNIVVGKNAKLTATIDNTSEETAAETGIVAMNAETSQTALYLNGKFKFVPEVQNASGGAVGLGGTAGINMMDQNSVIAVAEGVAINADAVSLTTENSGTVAALTFGGAQTSSAGISGMIDFMEGDMNAIVAVDDEASITSGTGASTGVFLGSENDSVLVNMVGEFSDAGALAVGASVGIVNFDVNTIAGVVDIDNGASRTDSSKVNDLVKKHTLTDSTVTKKMVTEEVTGDNKDSQRKNIYRGQLFGSKQNETKGSITAPYLGINAENDMIINTLAVAGVASGANNDSPTSGSNAANSSITNGSSSNDSIKKAFENINIAGAGSIAANVITGETITLLEGTQVNSAAVVDNHAEDASYIGAYSGAAAITLNKSNKKPSAGQKLNEVLDKVTNFVDDKVVSYGKQAKEKLQPTINKVKNSDAFGVVKMLIDVAAGDNSLWNSENKDSKYSSSVDDDGTIRFTLKENNGDTTIGTTKTEETTGADGSKTTTKTTESKTVDKNGNEVSSSKETETKNEKATTTTDANGTKDTKETTTTTQKQTTTNGQTTTSDPKVKKETVEKTTSTDGKTVTEVTKDSKGATVSTVEKTTSADGKTVTEVTKDSKGDTVTTAKTTQNDDGTVTREVTNKDGSKVTTKGYPDGSMDIEASYTDDNGQTHTYKSHQTAKENRNGFSGTLAGAVAVNVQVEDTKAIIANTDFTNVQKIENEAERSGVGLTAGLSAGVAPGGSSSTSGNNFKVGAGVSASVSIVDNDIHAHMLNNTNVVNNGNSFTTDISNVAKDKDIQIAGGVTAAYTQSNVQVGAAVVVTNINNDIEAKIADDGLVENRQYLNVGDVQNYAASKVIQIGTAVSAGVVTGNDSNYANIQAAVADNNLQNKVQAKVNGITMDANSFDNQAIDGKIKQEETENSFVNLVRSEGYDVDLSDATANVNDNGGNVEFNQAGLDSEDGDTEDIYTTRDFTANTSGNATVTGAISVAVTTSSDSYATVTAGAAVSTVINDFDSVISGSTITASGSKGVQVNADTNSTVVNIAGGVSYSGGQSGAGVGTYASVAYIGNDTTAKIDNSTITSDKVNVFADTDSQMVNVTASAAATKANVSLNGTVTTNVLDSDTEAIINSSTINAVEHENNVINGTDVSVNAENGAVVIGVGAGASVQTGNSGAAIGAVAVANVGFNNTVAKIDGTEAKRSVINNAKDIEVEAEDISVIVGIAGGLAVSQGNASVGGTIAYNELGASGNRENTVARINYTDITTVEDSAINVEVDDNAVVTSLSIGGVVQTGNSGAAIQGSAASNIVYKNSEASMTNTNIDKADEDETVNHNANVSLKADSDAVMISSADAISVSMANAAIGAAAAVTVSNMDTTAFVNGGTHNTKNELIEANSDSHIVNVGLGAAVTTGQGVSVAGNVAVNTIINDTTAYIDNANINSTGNVGVLAKSEEDIDNYTGALSVAAGQGYVAGGLSVATNVISGNTTAYVDNSSVNASGSDSNKLKDEGKEYKGLAVVADSEHDIRNVVLTGGVAVNPSEAAVAVSGTVAVNSINGATKAEITDSAINTDITDYGDVNVVATDEGDIVSVTGVLAVGVGQYAGVAVGEASDTNLFKRNVTASINGDVTNNTTKKSVNGNLINVLADSDNSVISNAVGVSVGGAIYGSAGYAGTLSVTLTEGNTLAEMRNVNSNNAGFVVDAEHETNVVITGNSLAANGSIGGGSLGLGIAVFNDKSDTQAKLLNSTLNNGESEAEDKVYAHNKSKVTNEIASVAAAITIGASGGGSVGVNNLDNTVKTSVDHVTISGTNADFTAGAYNEMNLKFANASAAVGIGAGAVGVGVNTIDTSVVTDVANSTINTKNINVYADENRDVTQYGVRGTAAGFALNSDVMVTVLGTAMQTTYSADYSSSNAEADGAHNSKYDREAESITGDRSATVDLNADDGAITQVNNALNAQTQKKNSNAKSGLASGYSGIDLQRGVSADNPNKKANLSIKTDTGISNAQIGVVGNDDADTVTNVVTFGQGGSATAQGVQVQIKNSTLQATEEASISTNANTKADTQIYQATVNGVGASFSVGVVDNKSKSGVSITDGSTISGKYVNVEAKLDGEISQEVYQGTVSGGALNAVYARGENKGTNNIKISNSSLNAYVDYVTNGNVKAYVDGSGVINVKTDDTTKVDVRVIGATLGFGVGGVLMSDAINNSSSTVEITSSEFNAGKVSLTERTIWEDENGKEYRSRFVHNREDGTNYIEATKSVGLYVNYYEQNGAAITNIPSGVEVKTEIVGSGDSAETKHYYEDYTVPTKVPVNLKENSTNVYVDTDGNEYSTEDWNIATEDGNSYILKPAKHYVTLKYFTDSAKENEYTGTVQSMTTDTGMSYYYNAPYEKNVTARTVYADANNIYYTDYLLDGTTRYALDDNGAINISSNKNNTVKARTINGALAVETAYGSVARSQEAGTSKVDVKGSNKFSSKELTISATNAPSVQADTDTGLAGVVAAGASVAVAKANGKAITEVAAGNNFNNENVNIGSKVATKNGANTAAAKVIGVAVSLGSVTANVATASANMEAKTSVAANTYQKDKNGNYLTNLVVDADNGTVVESDAYGVTVGGLVAVGTNVANAKNNTKTSVELTGGANSGVANLNVIARGTNDSDADANGHGGGLLSVSPVAADASVDSYAATNVTLKGNIEVSGDAIINASQYDIASNHADSDYASAVGYNGAYSNMTIGDSAAEDYTSVNLGTADDALVMNVGGNLNVSANNILNVGGAYDYSINVGGYGGVLGASADLDNTINKEANINITNANTKITSQGTQTYDAMTKGDVSAKGKTISAGLATVPVTNVDSNITVNNRINVNGATIENKSALQDIAMGTSEDLNIAVSGAGATYGAAVSVAIADVDSTVTRNDSINISGNSVISSKHDVILHSGKDSADNNSLTKIIAESEVYNHSAIPITSENSLKDTLNQTNTINIGNGSMVKAVANVDLYADKGSEKVRNTSIKYSWAKSEVNDNFTSTSMGQTIPNSSNNNSITINGNVIAGVDSVIKVTIGKNGDSEPMQIITQLAQNLAISDNNNSQIVGLAMPTITIEDSEGIKYTNKVNGENKKSGSFVSKDGKVYENLKIEDFIVSYFDYATDLIKRYEDTTALMAAYDDKPDSVAYLGYRAEAQRILDKLVEMNLVSPNNAGGYTQNGGLQVDYIELPDLIASGGNINVNSSAVNGSGNLEAKGSPEITVNNNTNLYTKINNIYVGEAGGVVTYNGEVVDADTIGSVKVKATPGQAGNITINGNYNNGEIAGTGQYNGETVSIEVTPMADIEINGLIQNVSGNVSITSQNNDIIMQGKNAGSSAGIEALNVYLNAVQGTISQGYTDGITNIGGSVESQYGNKYQADKDAYKEYQDSLGGTANSVDYTDVNSIRTGDAAGNLSGNMIAGKNIYLNSSDININGKIQAGYAQYIVNLNGEDSCGIGSLTVQQRINAIQTKYDQENPGAISNAVLTSNSNYLVKAGGNVLQSDGTYAYRPAVYYNPSTKNIVVADIDAQGGKIYLTGRISSTGGGQITALDGAYDINITNNITSATVAVNDDVNASYDVGLQVGKLLTNDVAGLISITDVAKGEITEYTRDRIVVRDLKTLDTLTNAEGKEYKEYHLKSSTAVSDYSSVNYNPSEGLRYNWTTGSETAETKSYSKEVMDGFWGVWHDRKNETSLIDQDVKVEHISSENSDKIPGSYIGTLDDKLQYMVYEPNDAARNHLTDLANDYTSAYQNYVNAVVKKENVSSAVSAYLQAKKEYHNFLSLIGNPQELYEKHGSTYATATTAYYQGLDHNALEGKDFVTLYTNTVLDNYVTNEQEKSWTSGYLGCHHNTRYTWDVKTGSSQTYIASVKADKPIKINFIGSADGESNVTVNSAGNVYMTGAVGNKNVAYTYDSNNDVTSATEKGSVSIIAGNDSHAGNIYQSDGAYIYAKNVSLTANGGSIDAIGIMAGDNVNLSANASNGRIDIDVKANYKAKGNVNLVSNIGNSSTDVVDITAAGNITQDSGKLITGNRINLVSENGSVGTAGSVINVRVGQEAKALDSLSASLNITAAEDIYVQQTNANENLRVGTINAGNIVNITTAGSIVDAIPYDETVDRGDNDYLIEKWMKLGIIAGNGETFADKKAKDIAAFKEQITKQFATAEELLIKAQDGTALTVDEQKLVAKFDGYVSAEDYWTRNADAQKYINNSTWTANELLYAIQDRIINNTEVHTNTKAPNVKGKEITLNIGKNSGDLAGTSTEINAKTDIDASTEAGLANLKLLATADPSSVTFSKDADGNAKFIVQDILPLGIETTGDGKVSVVAQNGNAFIEGRSGDSDKDVDLKLDKVQAVNGDVFVRTSGSILDVNTGTNATIVGKNADLEAEHGSIGTSATALKTDITGVLKRAVAAGEININQVSEHDLKVQAVNGAGAISLAASGNIVSFVDTDTEAQGYIFEKSGAGTINITSRNGNIGYIDASATETSDASQGLRILNSIVTTEEDGTTRTTQTTLVAEKGYVNVEGVSNDAPNTAGGVLDLAGVKAGGEVKIADNGGVIVDGVITAGDDVDIDANGDVTVNNSITSDKATASSVAITSAGGDINLNQGNITATNVDLLAAAGAIAQASTSSTDENNNVTVTYGNNAIVASNINATAHDGIDLGNNNNTANYVALTNVDNDINLGLGTSQNNEDINVYVYKANNGQIIIHNYDDNVQDASSNNNLIVDGVLQALGQDENGNEKKYDIQVINDEGDATVKELEKTETNIEVDELVVGDEITVFAKGKALNKRAISGVKDVLITAETGDAINEKNVTTDTGNIIVRADEGNIANSGNLTTTAGNISMDAAGNIDNDGDLLTTAGDITMNAAGNIDNDGTLTANTAATSKVELNADGVIDNSEAIKATTSVSMTAKGDNTVAAGNVIVAVNNTGNITAGTSVSIIADNSTEDSTVNTAGSVQNSGVINAGTDVALKAGKDVTNTDATITTTSGKVELVSATKGDVTNTNSAINAGDAVKLEAVTGKVENTNSAIIAGDAVTLESKNGDVINTNSSVEAGNSVTLKATEAGNVTNEAGSLTAQKGDVVLNTKSGNVVNKAGKDAEGKEVAGNVEAQAGKVELSTENGSVSNSDSILKAAESVSMTATGAVTNTNGAITATKGEAVLKSTAEGNVTNTNSAINAGDTVKLEAVTGKVENTNSAINAGDAVTLESKNGDVTNTNSSVEAGNSVTLKATEAGNVTNEAGSLTAEKGDVVLNTKSGNVVNKAGKDAEGKEVASNVEAQAGKVELSTENGSVSNSDSTLKSAESVSVTATGAVTNTNGAITATKGEAVLKSTVEGNVTNTNSAINAGDTVKLEAVTGKVENTNSAIIADDTVTLESKNGDVTNTNSSVEAGNSVTLKATEAGDVTNEAGSLTAEKGDVVLNTKSGNVVNKAGKDAEGKEVASNVEAKAGKVELSTENGSVSNSDSILKAAESVSVTATGAVTNTNGAITATEGEVVLKSTVEGDVTNTNSAINAGDTVKLEAVTGNVTNTNSEINAGDAVKLEAVTGKVENTNSAIIADDTVTLESKNGDVTNTNSSVEAGNSVTLKATEAGDVTNEAGNLTAQKGDVVLNTKSGNVVNKAGKDAEGKEVASNVEAQAGKVELSTENGSVSNSDSTLKAAESVSLTASGNVTNTNGAITATEGEAVLKSTAEGNVTNTNSEINAGDAVKLEAVEGDVTNTNSAINAGDAVTLESKNGDVTNTNSSVEAGNSVTLKATEAGDVTNEAGSLTAQKGDVVLNTKNGNITNKASAADASKTSNITAITGNVALRSEYGNVNNGNRNKAASDAENILAGKNITIEAINGSVNSNGNLTSGEALLINSQVNPGQTQKGAGVGLTGNLEAKKAGIEIYTDVAGVDLDGNAQSYDLLRVWADEGGVEVSGKLEALNDSVDVGSGNGDIAITEVIAKIMATTGTEKGNIVIGSIDGADVILYTSDEAAKIKANHVKAKDNMVLQGNEIELPDVETTDKTQKLRMLADATTETSAAGIGTNLDMNLEGDVHFESLHLNDSSINVSGKLEIENLSVSSKAHLTSLGYTTSVYAKNLSHDSSDAIYYNYSKGDQLLDKAGIDLKDLYYTRAKKHDIIKRVLKDLDTLGYTNGPSLGDDGSMFMYQRTYNMQETNGLLLHVSNKRYVKAQRFAAEDLSRMMLDYKGIDTYRDYYEDLVTMFARYNTYELAEVELKNAPASEIVIVDANKKLEAAIAEDYEALTKN